VHARRLLACLLGLLLAGCGGERAGDAAVPAQQELRPQRTEAGRVDPRPGRVLLGFVQAAGRGHADAMWALLSDPTQASFGPTFAAFRRGAAFEFRDGLGSLAPNARVTFSRTLAGGWAVAAVSGERNTEGERERFAYAAALVRERGALRLELGGIVFSDHRPEPNGDIKETRPRLSVKASAGRNVTAVRAWLDGRALPTTRGADDPPFTATIRALPDRVLSRGLHEVVVFAAAGDTAAAASWGFVVE
jgi:hypothetical protein